MPGGVFPGKVKFALATPFETVPDMTDDPILRHALKHRKRHCSLVHRGCRAGDCSRQRHALISRAERGRCIRRGRRGGRRRINGDCVGGKNSRSHASAAKRECAYRKRCGRVARNRHRQRQQRIARTRHNGTRARTGHRRCRRRHAVPGCSRRNSSQSQPRWQRSRHRHPMIAIWIARGTGAVIGQRKCYASSPALLHVIARSLARCARSCPSPSPDSE